jgi:hypothetical protein
MDWLEKLKTVLDEFKPLVKEIVGERSDFENIWTNVTTDFISWIQKPNRSTSFLDVKIALVQTLIDAFSNDSIRTNKNIIDVVVAETIVGGKEFKLRNWRGVFVSRPIIDRYISKKGGIMLTLKNKIGWPFKYEYID